MSQQMVVNREWLTWHTLHRLSWPYKLSSRLFAALQGKLISTLKCPTERWVSAHSVHCRPNCELCKTDHTCCTFALFSWCSLFPQNSLQLYFSIRITNLKIYSILFFTNNTARARAVPRRSPAIISVVNLDEKISIKHFWEILNIQFIYFYFWKDEIPAVKQIRHMVISWSTLIYS